MQIEVVVACRPTTKGNHKQIVRGRGGRPMLIGSTAARAAEAELVALLRPSAPAEPWDCPVAVDVEALLPAPRRLRGDSGGYPVGRPDRGNLLKCVEDALQKAGYFRDDAQIVDGRVAKRYVDIDELPGYRITVRELSQAPLGV